MARSTALAALFLLGALASCSEDAAPGGGGSGSGTAPPEVPSVDEPRGWTIGESVQGRPIVVERFGDSGPLVLFMAAIHGNERPAVLFGERMRSALLGGIAEANGVQIVLLPAANPDGVVGNSRANSRGIDLNRNFPSKNFAPSDSHGQAPLQEPESLAVASLIESLDPVAIVTVHNPLHQVDWNGPGEALAKAMADASGIPFEPPIGGLPGSLGSWAGEDMGIPTITLELPSSVIGLAGYDPGWDAVRVAIAWAAHGEVAPPGPAWEPEDAQASPLESWTFARSAGGLPMRAEAWGDADAPAVLVVAGLAGDPGVGAFVAERVRSAVLQLPGAVEGARIVMVTAANPDGLNQGEPTNAAGVVVGDDFAGEPTEPESQALSTLVRALEPQLVVVLEAGDTKGTVVAGPASKSVRAALADLPLPAEQGAPPAGSFAAYVADALDTPVIVLRAGPSVQTESQARLYGDALFALVDAVR